MAGLIDRLLRHAVPLVDGVFRIAIVRQVAIVFDRFGRVGGPVLSAGLATRALFALLPGLLLVVAGIGFVVRDPRLQERILELIQDLVPPLQSLITDTVDVLADGAAAFGVIGLIGLLWGASGFFQTLEVVFAVVLGEEQRRDPFRRAVIGVVGVMAAALAIGIVSFGAIVAWTVVADWVQPFVDLGSIRALAPILTTIIAALALGIAYRTIPQRRPTVADVWLPAVLAGLAIAILTQVFAFLGPLVAGTASLYGAISAIFILLVWLQLTTQVVVLGMVWTGMRAFGWPPRSEIPWPAGDLRRPDVPAEPVTQRADEPPGTEAGAP
jgi:membrane protein